MGLRIRGNMWMDLFGRMTISSIIIIYFVVSILFSYPLLYVIKLVDKWMEKVFLNVLNIDTNIFLQHSFSYVSNFIICIIFFDLTIESFKIKNKTNRTSDIFLFHFSLTFLILEVFLSTISLFVPNQWFALQLFFSILVSVFINEIFKRFGRFSDAVDLKIDIATLEKMNENVIRRGFMTIAFTPGTTPDRNMLITCSSETYQDLHIIMKMYSDDSPTRKMLLHFFKDKSITLDANYNFIDANGNILTVKEFMTMYHEYVADFKRLNSTEPIKEFLGL